MQLWILRNYNTPCRIWFITSPPHGLKNVAHNWSIYSLAVWSMVFTCERQGYSTCCTHSTYTFKLRLKIWKHVKLFIFQTKHSVAFHYRNESWLFKTRTLWESWSSFNIVDTVFSMWSWEGRGNEGKQVTPCAKALSDPSAAIYRTGMKALAVAWPNSFTRSFHFSSLRRKGERSHTEHLILCHISHFPLSNTHLLSYLIHCW